MKKIVPAIAVFLVVSAACAGEPILKESARWRSFWTWRTVLKQNEDGTYAPLEEVVQPTRDRHGNIQYGQFSNPFAASSPLPPEEWRKPDFDDSLWGVWSKIWSKHGDDIGSVRYGIKVNPTIALRCLRGRFTVDNPAAVEGLALSVSYRGGIVVYLNGTEIARQHLPDGTPLDMLAMAENYPRKAFVHTSGKQYNPKYGPMSDDVNSRIRKLENVSVPSTLLRKGVNVLALEIHRAPFQEELDHQTSWNTCGLVSMTLDAAKAPGVGSNIGTRPEGIQVWNASVTKFVSCADYGEPFVPVRPVRIAGVRNGRFCAQVVVGSDKDMGPIRATVSDLKAVSGKGTVPASNVEILYGTNRDPRKLRPDPMRGAFELTGLSPVPPEKVAVPGNRSTSMKDNFGAELPVWLKIYVPKETPAGEYGGSMNITVDGARVADVPVHLKVFGWTLPDPKDNATYIDLIQSPDSVAMQYRVEPWSKKHFELMEKSFALMGQMGADHVYLPLIAKTNFGNPESMVRWIRKPGGGYDHDFTIFDAYLDMALRHLNPKSVCLYVWDLYVGASGGGGRLGRAAEKAGKAGPLVTVVDPKSGAREEMEGPECKSREARDFWRPVFEKVRQRLRDRGLEQCMMIGVTDDFIPTDDVLDLLGEVASGVPWVQHSHPGTFGIRRRDDARVGYIAGVYIDMFPFPQPWNKDRLCGWQRKDPVGVFPRMIGGVVRHAMGHRTHLGVHRFYNEAVLLGNHSGIGRVGVDFWPLVKGRYGMTSICGRYPNTSWVQLNLSEATSAILEPGPDGALPTPRFENLREGIQECETRIFIEKAVTDPALQARLGADLVGRCREMLDERHTIIRAGSTSGAWGSSQYHPFLWCEGEPWPCLAEKLFKGAEDVAAALKKGG